MRQDVIALSSGLVFIIFILGMMWLWGELEGWYAPSGYVYDDVNDTQERFLPEPYYCNDTSIPGRSGHGCTGSWYFWKLSPLDSNAVTKATVWILYSLHQIFIWGLIYRAQLTVAMQKIDGNEESPYGKNLRWFNWSMLIVNGLFHILHLIQTHTTYDATAQDVSIASSQSSVIMMLCFILLIEYQNRGLILLWPTPQSQGKVAKIFRLHSGPLTLVRKYHGYIFAWACIYTFWYHPMENTWGHTLGFFHTAIVLLQGSLAFTDVHLNKYWRLLNECWVFIHATAVAFQTGDPNVAARSDLWPIFCFGFGFVFAFTQVFSLPIWKKISTWYRIIPPAIFLAIVAVLCGTLIEGEDGASEFVRMIDMVYIPFQEYLQCCLAWFFLYIFLKMESISKKPKNENMKENSRGDFVMPSPTKQAICLCGFMVVYAIMIFVSHIFRDAPYEISFAFAVIFSLGTSIGCMFMKALLGPTHCLFVRTKDESSNSSGPSTTQHVNHTFDYAGEGSTTEIDFL